MVAQFQARPTHTPAGKLLSAGKPVCIQATVSNPFARSFGGVKATLMVDGKPTETKVLGTMLPKQRRTVELCWVPPKEGNYDIQILLEGMPRRTRQRKRMKATVSGQVRVTPSKVRTELSKPLPATLRPAEPLTRELSPFLRRPAVQKGTPLRPAAPLGPIVGLSSRHIHLKPARAAVGDSVGLSILLFNRGRAAAKDAKVEVFVDGQRLGEARVDVPAGTQRVVSGFPKWRATAGKHTARAVLTLGGVQQQASKPFVVSAVTATPTRPVPSPGARPTILKPPQPLLVVRPLDIHLTPARPQVGDRVRVTVAVQNRGRTDARGVQLAAMVDGKTLGQARFDVPAGRSALVRGLPLWTATAGRHAVEVVAGLGRQRRRAVTHVTVGTQTATPIRRPRLPATVKPRPTGPRAAAAPVLALRASDILINPGSPRPGDTVQIRVRVWNRGRAEAKKVAVELSVDRKPLRAGKATVARLTVPPRSNQQSIAFGWKATQGRHLVRARVAMPGQKPVEVQRTLDVAAKPSRGVIIKPGAGGRKLRPLRK